MLDEKQLISGSRVPVIIDKSNSRNFTDSVKEFISKLTPQERAIIRKQLTYGIINQEEMAIIQASVYDINCFLSNCKDLTEIEKALVINTIDDFIMGTKEKFLKILNFTGSNKLNKIGDDILDIRSLDGTLELKK